MEPDQTYERVRVFTAKYTGEDLASIHSNSGLQNDLAIAGLDGMAFMDNFFEEFEVDYTDFVLDKYICEGFRPLKLTILLRRLFGLST